MAHKKDDANAKRERTRAMIVATPMEMRRIAAMIVKKNALKPRKGALCIALSGELGSGKTTFVQGAGRSLGIARPLSSPTFVLMRAIALPRQKYGLSALYHFDWYRLAGEGGIKTLGWDEIIRNPHNAVFVEWADRAAKLFPAYTVWIEFAHANGKQRTIRIREK